LKAVQNLIAWTPLVNTPLLVQPFADKALHGQWDPLAKAYVLPGSGKALSDAKKLLATTPYKSGFPSTLHHHRERWTRRDPKCRRGQLGPSRCENQCAASSRRFEALR
jgi:hypothetical protein